MRNIDRILVLVLAVGVWALVLKPTTITAHDSNSHGCMISGYAEGTASGGLALIEHWNNVYINCAHLRED